MSGTCTKCLRTASRSVLSKPDMIPRRAFRILVPQSYAGGRYHPSRPASSSSTAPATPKRPSPYRLIPVSTFLADFAPLHIKGWRLDSLPTRAASASASAPGQAEVHEGGMVELQDRRLIRRYDFDQGKQGWRDLMAFVQKVGEVVESEDHHPSIHISPGSDFSSPFLPVPLSVGYVLSISTQTHTPMPPLKYPNKDETMRPGVTGKDMKLASKLEEVYEGIRVGRAT